MDALLFDGLMLRSIAAFTSTSPQSARSRCDVSRSMGPPPSFETRASEVPFVARVVPRAPQDEGRARPRYPAIESSTRLSSLPEIWRAWPLSVPKVANAWCAGSKGPRTMVTDSGLRQSCTVMKCGVENGARHHCDAPLALFRVDNGIVRLVRVTPSRVTGGVTPQSRARKIDSTSSLFFRHVFVRP